VMTSPMQSRAADLRREGVMYGSWWTLQPDRPHRGW
jgi:hypothetical protein